MPVPTNISEEQYLEAREIASAYERAKAEAAAAARAAYAVPVKALVESEAFHTVYDALGYMLANFTDDSFFGMPVGALHTISKNLGTQVGVDMDAPAAPETPAEGDSA